jgi:hypothetical protein
VFSFEQEGLENYPVVGKRTMGGKSALLLREEAARTRAVLASIGRGLRQRYGAPQPVTERLAELMRKIEQSANEAEDRG